MLINQTPFLYTWILSEDMLILFTILFNVISKYELSVLRLAIDSSRLDLCISDFAIV